MDNSNKELGFIPLMGEGFRVISNPANKSAWVLSQHEVKLMADGVPSPKEITDALQRFLSMSVGNLAETVAEQFGEDWSPEAVDELTVKELFQFVAAKAGKSGSEAVFTESGDGVYRHQGIFVDAFGYNTRVINGEEVKTPSDEGQKIDIFDPSDPAFTALLKKTDRCIILQNPQELKFKEDLLPLRDQQTETTDRVILVESPAELSLLEGPDRDVNVISEVDFEQLRADIKLSFLNASLDYSQVDGLGADQIVKPFKKEIPDSVLWFDFKAMEEQVKAKFEEGAVKRETSEKGYRGTPSILPKAVLIALHEWAKHSKESYKHQLVVEDYLTGLGESIVNDDGIRDILVDYVDNTMYDAGTAADKLEMRISELTE